MKTFGSILAALCPAALVRGHGRLGNDVLHAAQVGYGGPGIDRWIAPVRVGCER
jgi:hypothetical protein